MLVILLKYTKKNYRPSNALNKDMTEVENLNVALDHAIIRYRGQMHARVLHALSGVDFDSIEVGSVCFYCWHKYLFWRI